MSEWRVPEIVSERNRFGEVLVEPQGAGDVAGNARDFHRVSEAGAQMIASAVEEHLGLVLEAAKCARMDDAVAIALILRRSEEHTSELQSQFHLVCRLLLEKKNE